MWRDGNNGGGWLVMGFVMILLLALAVAALIWALRDRAPSHPQPWAGAPTPRQILDERFARGELDEEEYRKRRDLLAAR